MVQNFFLIYISIFCFGVSAGLVLSNMIQNRSLHKSRKRSIWKV